MLDAEATAARGTVQQLRAAQQELSAAKEVAAQAQSQLEWSEKEKASLVERIVRGDAEAAALRTRMQQVEGLLDEVGEGVGLTARGESGVEGEGRTLGLVERIVRGDAEAAALRTRMQQVEGNEVSEGVGKGVVLAAGFGVDEVSEGVGKGVVLAAGFRVDGCEK